MKGRIHIKGMIFFGYHGHRTEEKTLGQRFTIDLVLSVEIGEAARTDELVATVDYLKVFQLCRDVVENHRVKLLETLAAHVIDRILADFPLVQEVDITIKKPSVSAPGVLDYVAIETRKTRA